MSSISLDDHVAANLEPEELAAIRGDADPEQRGALESIAAGAPEDADEDEGAIDADGNPVDVAAAPAPAPAAAAPAPAEAAAPAPAAAVADTPADDQDSAPGPAFVAPLPDDFDAQVKAAKDAAKDLAAQFKAGEIDFDTYQAENDKLAEQREELRSMRTQHEVAQKMELQAAQRQVDAERNRIFRLAKAEGIDYAADAAMFGDLDTFVKMLGANPANNNKPLAWFVDEAHKRVKTLYGVASAPAAAPAAPQTKAQIVAAAVAARKPPIDAAPKGLAHVPGGDGPGDVASEFADVDNLVGDALDDAIARMTPERRERYMRGQ